jgi:hypothetical protein
MILDSNIIIYAADPNYIFLREFIKTHVPMTSIVSYIEVLGYDKLSEAQRTYFEEYSSFSGNGKIKLELYVTQYETYNKIEKQVALVYQPKIM